jgi:hypothetical protein
VSERRINDEVGLFESSGLDRLIADEIANGELSLREQLVGFVLGTRTGNLLETESVFYRTEAYRRRAGTSVDPSHPIAMHNEPAISIIKAIKWLTVEYLYRLGINIHNIGMVTQYSDDVGGMDVPFAELAKLFYALAVLPEGVEPIKFPTGPQAIAPYLSASAAERQP